MLNKAVQKLRGEVTWQDLVRFALPVLQRKATGLTGTMVLYLKAWLLGIEMGKGVVCYGKIDIIPAIGSTIKIGNDVSIVSSSTRCTSSSLFATTKLRTWSKSSKIIIEEGVGLNGTSIVARSKTVSIGANTMIAPNVVIFDSDFHALWPPGNRVRNPAFENDEDVYIGKNVWIGSSCIIKKGVSIGDNTVVAAGSVVTKDLSFDVLAGGVPAKALRLLADSKARGL